jgi:hypothetical protein
MKQLPFKGKNGFVKTQTPPFSRLVFLDNHMHVALIETNALSLWTFVAPTFLQATERTRPKNRWNDPRQEGYSSSWKKVGAGKIRPQSSVVANTSS